MAAGQSDDLSSAFLLGDSPSLEKIYNPENGQALLLPDVPLSPPTPSANASRIGIIDSGVLAEHPQLRNLVVAMKSFTNTTPADHIGHGTLVALEVLRTISEAQLSPHDKLEYPGLISARVTDQNGVPSVDAVIEAIDWVVEQGAKVVNLSLGFRGEAKQYSRLCEAIARHQDVLFSAAAGNFGPDVKVFPAACHVPNLISVGEVRGENVAPTSGKGDIYATSGGPLYEPWQYHLDLGERASRIGGYATARQEYALSLKHHRNLEALFQMALLDIYADDLDAAEKNLEEAMQMNPEIAVVRSHLGAVCLMQGRFNKAEVLLRKAMQQDPQDQRTVFNLGLTLVNLNRPDQALKLFQQLRELNPDYPRLAEVIAETENLLGRRQE